MNGRPSHKLTGAFVLGAIALIVTGLVVFGSGKLFQARIPAVMFFTEPVSGLDVGAPLLFNGVQIGIVTDIDLVWILDDNTFRTPVYIDFLPDTLQYAGGTRQEIADIRRGEGNYSSDLVKRGLRAQLGVSSILTGKLLINLVMRPDTEPRFVSEVPDSPEILEIPTIPSDIARVKAKLSNLPLEKIVENFNETLIATRKILDNPEIDGTISEARGAVADARRLLASIEAKVDLLSESLLGTSDTAGKAAGEAKALFAESRGAVAKIDPLLQSARAALKEAEALLNTVDGVIEPGSPLYNQLLSTLGQVGEASRSIRSLANTLERNPDSILFGR